MEEQRRRGLDAGVLPRQTATQLRILSIREDAASPGVAGNAWGTTPRWRRSSTMMSRTRPARPSTSTARPSFNAFNLSHEGALSATSVWPTATNCTTNSTISGSVLLENGNADLTNTCTIKGDVHVSGSVKITSNVPYRGHETLIASAAGSRSQTAQSGRWRRLRQRQRRAARPGRRIAPGDGHGHRVCHREDQWGPVVGGKDGDAREADGASSPAAPATCPSTRDPSSAARWRGRRAHRRRRHSTLPTCTSGSANDRSRGLLNARAACRGRHPPQTGLAAPVARAAPVVRLGRLVLQLAGLAGSAGTPS